MNPSPIRILLHGATGRMGQALIRLLPEFPALTLVAAVSHRPAAATVHGAPWLAAAELGDAPAFDVAVDFSLPPALPALIDACRERGVALVSGTTGLDAQASARLAQAASQVPVLWAANFSLGVAVLADLAARAAEVLPDWDCDIVESHHTHKRDAPSGTALMLAEQVASRHSRPNVHAIRAGDIVGEHAIRFSGLGETLELAHRAATREIFARGALVCASRIAGRNAGRYTVLELLRAN